MQVNNILLFFSVYPDTVRSCANGEVGDQMTCGVGDGDVDCVVVDELICGAVPGCEFDWKGPAVFEIELIQGCDWRKESDIVSIFSVSINHWCYIFINYSIIVVV